MRAVLTRCTSALRDHPGAAALAAGYFFLILGFLLFRDHQAVAVMTDQKYDDNYFMAQAQLLRDGHWLGAYGPHTLVKAPGYSYFLVLNNLLGTSYTFLIAVFHLAACAAFTLVLVRTLKVPRVAGFVVFAALLLQPVSVPVRIYRDALSDSLLLLTVAGLLALAFGRRDSRWRFLQWAATGLALGMFWIAREESMWLAPTVLAALLAAVVGTRRAGRGAAFQLAGAVAVVAVTAAIPTVATAGINKAQYGTFVVSDFTRGPFQELVVQLDRIDTVPEIPRIPVPNEALDAAFAASPTFAKLQEAFASPPVRAWALGECPDVPKACGQIPGSIFSWALRDAAAEADLHTSAERADEFYARAAEELAAACGKAYPCRPRPISAVPALTQASVDALPASVGNSFLLTLYQGDGAVPAAGPSVDIDGRLATALDFLGQPEHTPTDEQPARDANRFWKGLDQAQETAYRVLTPILMVAGLVSFLGIAFACLFRRRKLPTLLIGAGVLWIAYGSRVALIALVDATTFSAIIPQYLQPAYVLGCAAASMSVIAAVAHVRDRRRAQTAETTETTETTELVGGPTS